MATNTNIKAALSFDDTDVFGLGPKTVGNAELLRLKAWFEDEYAEQLDGREATAHDFASWMYRQVKGKVVQRERRVAENAIPDADEFEEVV